MMPFTTSLWLWAVSRPSTMVRSAMESKKVLRMLVLTSTTERNISALTENSARSSSTNLSEVRSLILGTEPTSLTLRPST